MNKHIILQAIVIALVINLNGCGSSNRNGITDISDYFEKNNQVRNMINIYQNRHKEESRQYYTEEVSIKENVLNYKVKNNTNVILTVNNNHIKVVLPQNDNYSYLIKRYVTIGEEISTYTLSSSRIRDNITQKRKETRSCIFDAKLNDLTIKSKTVTITYEGDIVRQKCTSIISSVYTGDMNEIINHTNIDYTYYQKDKGQIAGENRNCWVKHKNRNLEDNTTYYAINDLSKECEIRTNNQILLLE